MTNLYPGISATAARRLARIAGDFSALSEQEQLAFTTQLRERRKRGSSAKAVKEGDNNGDETEESESEAARDEGAAKREDSEGVGDTASEGGES